MAKFTDAIRATLTGYFNAGDQPTEAQFTALILAIQEGIEEHQHDGTGDGDGTGILDGPITMADDSWIGIGAALERIVFDTAGDICVMGAKFGIGLLNPAYASVISGEANPVVQILSTDDAGTSSIYFGDPTGAAVGRIVYAHDTDNEMQFWTNGTQQVTIDDAGYVGLGAPAPAYPFTVENDFAGFIANFFNDGDNTNRDGVNIQCGLDTNPVSKLLRFADGNGTLIGYVIGDGAAGVTYFSSSDERNKNILGPIDQAKVMKALVEVNPIQYVGKGLTKKSGRKNFGFSAQDIYKYFPEVARLDEEDRYGLSYERLVPVLWAQNQVLLERIEQLEAK